MSQKFGEKNSGAKNSEKKILEPKLRRKKFSIIPVKMKARKKKPPAKTVKRKTIPSTTKKPITMLNDQLQCKLPLLI